MKKLLIFFSLFLYAKVQFYAGQLEIGEKKGVYEGVLYDLSSEDETLDVKLAYRRVNIYDKNFIQNETFIYVLKETNLDEHIEFAFQDIHNPLNTGNIYILNWLKQNKIDYKIGGSFSNYDSDKSYQMNFQFNSFIFDTSFYITPTYYILNVKNDRLYNSLSLKLGYMQGKSDGFISFLIGKNRYLVTDDKYYSCNFGYVTKYAYKFSYSYQVNLNFIIKLSYYNYRLVDNKLKAYNLAISYQY